MCAILLIYFGLARRLNNSRRTGVDLVFGIVIGSVRFGRVVLSCGITTTISLRWSDDILGRRRDGHAATLEKTVD